MKDGKCPFCESTSIFTSDNALLRASGNALQLIEAYSELNTHLRPYVCTECGYVIMFVKKTEQLKKLENAKGWKPVN